MLQYWHELIYDKAMLLEYSVENFKSIKDKVVFSMFADDDELGSSENFFDLKSKGFDFSVLKSALIFGANASGKSSFASSLSVLQQIIRNSSKHTPDDLFPLSPFKLSKKTVNAPTNFCVHFLFDRIHYAYELSLMPSKVLYENLYLFNGSKKDIVFERKENEFFLDLSHEDDTVAQIRQQIYSEDIAENILFLSLANKINNKHVKNTFTWFSKKLYLLSQLNPTPYTRRFLDENIIDKETVLEYLKNADSFIVDMIIKKRETQFTPETLHQVVEVLSKQQSIPIEILKQYKMIELSESMARCSIDEDEKDKLIEFQFNEESMGTQKFYNLLGPVVSALKNGQTIICDEFENSLHHLLALNICKKFLSEQNNNGAQLVSIVHDINLLNEDIFRNDQIWFVNKNCQASTELYSLSDFDAPPSRKDLLKEYLRGTLGGITPRL